MIESGLNRIKITSADFLQKGTKKSWKPEKCIWHGHKDPNDFWRSIDS